jgi:NAD(P)-dependent dehydrogenase (short-subunit alcohol dehydrogenase family)
MPETTLKDKVVVITGGAGLLGTAFSRAVVESGGIAIVADKDAERGERTAKEINSACSGARATFCHLDINDLASIDDLIDRTKQRLGRIDALVNNAYPRNKNYGRKFEDVTREDFCENVSLHVGGYFLASQAFISFFRNQGHGNIVNMASVYGFLAPRFEIYEGTTMTMPVEYAVIKASILQLTKYLSSYLKGQNIRVNAISPGGIVDAQPESFLKAYGEFCAGKGMLNDRDICGSLVFLLSDLSTYVNGHNLVVDDGFTI